MPDLVPEFVDVAVAAVDVACGIWPRHLQHRRVERLGRQHRRARIQEAGARERTEKACGRAVAIAAQRHIGRALFVASVQDLQPTLPMPTTRRIPTRPRRTPRFWSVTGSTTAGLVFWRRAVTSSARTGSTRR